MKRHSSKPNSRFVPPRRSIYRKLQIVLAELRKSRSSSEDDLIQRIRKAGHEDFTAYVKGEPKPCSEEAVKHVLKLAKELRLLDPVTCSLTTKGEKAADLKSFDGVIRRSLQDFLSEMGSPLEKLIALTTQLLSRHSSQTLPTWDVLFERILPDADSRTKKRFQEALSLLSMTGGIRFTRRKIYLPE